MTRASVFTPGADREWYFRLLLMIHSLRWYLLSDTGALNWRMIRNLYPSQSVLLGSNWSIALRPSIGSLSFNWYTPPMKVGIPDNPAPY